MFEQTFVQTQSQIRRRDKEGAEPRTTRRRPWTVALSLSVQCLAVAVLLLIPLLHPEALRMPGPPQQRIISTWIDQPPLPLQKPAAPNTATSAPSAPRPLFVPPGVHATAARAIDVPPGDSEPAAWAGQVGTGFTSPLAIASTLPPRIDAQKLPVQPSAKPTVSGPVKISSGVEGAKLVFGPRPLYPPLAKAARSQGIVRLEAIIAADGSIRNLRVVSGPPLLVSAALAAVKQWRYQPTLLNGTPVEVITGIEVNFSLTN